jgi:hypothetical protein
VSEYLIVFNDEWIGEITDEQLGEAGARVRALRAEMDEAGVLVYTNGLDTDIPPFHVDASSGEPVFEDGPYVETKEHLGGFAIVDVADETAARFWAGKVAVACGWPQEVHRFHRRGFRAGQP